MNLNKTVALSVILAALQSVSSHASDCNVGKKSNYIVIPHYLVSSNGDAAFYITNHSDKTVEVKVQLYTSTGADFSGSTQNYYSFTSSNTPFNEWATLGNKEQGLFYAPFQSGTTSGHARVSWQANECLGTPVSVSLQHTSKNIAGHAGWSIESFGPF